VIQKAARAANSLLLPEEEHVIVWIGERQRQGDCPSPREVRNFAGDLFERRTHHERTFTRDWWRGFLKCQSEGFLVRIGAVKQAQRTEVTCGSALAYFAELGNVLPACVTPSQIMNMAETGLSMRPMKGQARKLVSVKSCAVRPTFHEENDNLRTYMSTMLIVTRPKFEGKIVRALRAWRTSAYIRLIYNGWKAGGLQVRGPLSNDAIPQFNSKKSYSSFARTAQMQR
jgi:hypothetical protein